MSDAATRRRRPYSSLSTNRIKLVVAYDGTDFSGWADQPGQRTVRRTLTDAVRQISGEEIEIIGASRTDSGAHALHQVCHFDCVSPMDPRKWPFVMNKVLPIDLSVKKSDKISSMFHARFSAVDRWYRYRIHLGRRNPHVSRYVHEWGRELDVDAMHYVADRLTGTHDFRAFSEELDENRNAVRQLFKVQLSRRGQELHIDIVGTAFVRGMMRRMSGLLLEVGRGYRPKTDVDLLLDPQRRNDLAWPVVLPAKGLTLMRVRHGRDRIDLRENPNPSISDGDHNEPFE